jgi:hypothetical protein
MFNMMSDAKKQSVYGRLVFGFFKFIPKIAYRVYLPDSLYFFKKYPETKALFNKWICKNTINNRGDLNRFYSIILNLQQILDDEIEGDFAELGVYQGTTASIIAHFANKGGRKFCLFDTFEGFDRRDLVEVDSSKAEHFGNEFSDTSYKVVSDFVGHKEICKYHVGYFPESVSEDAKNRVYSFVHLDCDLYKPMSDGLKIFWGLLSDGGLMFLHDYSSGYWDGAKQAVDEFCRNTGCFVVLLPDKSGTAVIRKNIIK